MHQKKWKMIIMLVVFFFGKIVKIVLITANYVKNCAGTIYQSLIGTVNRDICGLAVLSPQKSNFVSHIHSSDFSVHVRMAS